MGYEVVLFYRYVQLCDLERLIYDWTQYCSNNGILGRCLVASEGINGTFAGFDDAIQRLIQYIRDYDERFALIDFKLSAGTGTVLPFPQLSIYQTNEIISLGNSKDYINSFVSFDGSFGGLVNTGLHLDPIDFHDRIKNIDTEKSILIDVRNKFETDIGKFQNAIPVDTYYYSETWDSLDKIVDQNKEKEIFMYCTGGIRCEKASAYLRRKGCNNVYQLAGGIAKYIDTVNSNSSLNSLFCGKNFVFDARTKQQVQAQSTDTIGQCIECNCLHDDYSIKTNCTVCRYPVLICDKCQLSHQEYYCTRHRYLQGVYYSDITRFTAEELQRQVLLLQELLLSNELVLSKNKRKTIRKQIEKITNYMKDGTAEEQLPKRIGKGFWNADD